MTLVRLFSTSLMRARARVGGVDVPATGAAVADLAAAEREPGPSGGPPSRATGRRAAVRAGRRSPRRARGVPGLAASASREVNVFVVDREHRRQELGRRGVLAAGAHVGVVAQQAGDAGVARMPPSTRDQSSNMPSMGTSGCGPAGADPRAGERQGGGDQLAPGARAPSRAGPRGGSSCGARGTPCRCRAGCAPCAAPSRRTGARLPLVATHAQRTGNAIISLTPSSRSSHTEAVAALASALESSVRRTLSITTTVGARQLGRELLAPLVSRHRPDIAALPCLTPAPQQRRERLAGSRGGRVDDVQQVSPDGQGRARTGAAGAPRRARARPCRRTELAQQLLQDQLARRRQLLVRGTGQRPEPQAARGQEGGAAVGQQPAVVQLAGVGQHRHHDPPQRSGGSGSTSMPSATSRGGGTCTTLLPLVLSHSAARASRWITRSPVQGHGAQGAAVVLQPRERRLEAPAEALGVGG